MDIWYILKKILDVVVGSFLLLSVAYFLYRLSFLLGLVFSVFVWVFHLMGYSPYSMDIFLSLLVLFALHRFDLFLKSMGG